MDTTVVLDVTSTDVMHRWVIPALGGQVRRGPRADVSQTWFRADREGVYARAIDLLLGERLRGDAGLGPRGQPDRVRGVRASSKRADLGEAQDVRRRAETARSWSERPRPPPAPRPPRSSPTASRRRPAPGSSGRPAPTTSRSACSTSAPRSCFLALAAVELVLMRVQLIVPENTMIEPEIFDRLPVRVRGHRGDPVRDPARPRTDRLHRPAPDRLPRGRLPAPRPALVLALPGRGGDDLRELPLHGPPDSRHDRAAAAVGQRLLPGRRRRRLDRRAAGSRLSASSASRSTSWSRCTTCARPGWPGGGCRCSPGRRR